MPHPGDDMLFASKLLAPEPLSSCGCFRTSGPYVRFASLSERTPAHRVKERGAQSYTGCGHRCTYSCNRCDRYSGTQVISGYEVRWEYPQEP